MGDDFSVKRDIHLFLESIDRGGPYDGSRRLIPILDYPIRAKRHQSLVNPGVKCHLKYKHA